MLNKAQKQQEKSQLEIYFRFQYSEWNTRPSWVDECWCKSNGTEFCSVRKQTDSKKDGKWRIRRWINWEEESYSQAEREWQCRSCAVTSRRHWEWGKKEWSLSDWVSKWAKSSQQASRVWRTGRGRFAIWGIGTGREGEKGRQRKNPVKDRQVEHYAGLCPTTGSQHFVLETFTSVTEDETNLQLAFKCYFSMYQR